jgi:beta-lactamase class A
VEFLQRLNLKEIHRYKLKYFLLAALAIFGIGIVSGVFIGYLLPGSLPDLTDLSSEFHAGSSSGYQLINPLYECNTNTSYVTKELAQLKSSINTYINQLTANNSVTDVAVYYRNLNSGPWFGINEHMDFAPSSLLKVPVMMAYYKLAESNPAILNQKIKYGVQPEGVLPENFPPAHPLVLGQTYTVEELIEAMIIGSDNVALGLLEDNIDNQRIDQVTLDLGITTATAATPTDFMDVSEYSTLFRVLYYATYLNKDYSEKALQILSQSEFKQGLVDTLPKNIVLAHKFGEREMGNGIHQLHDCGIVYYPNNPYLLCIMTRGPDFNDLATTIQQVSDKIYQSVSNKYH